MKTWWWTAARCSRKTSARPKRSRYSEVKEGETVQGTVRSLTDYGAFVDIGGVDALLHVADISWGRINKPADVLSVGQQVEAKVLKVDPAKRRISLGMKQLLPHPWELAGEKYKTGERVHGTVTRVADFGAFVELEKGVEGLIHLSEMSWSKKVRKPSDVVKPGDQVEVVILGVNQADRRISLGLKQALGDPWAEVPQKYPVGSVVEAPVVSLQKFGAFVQLAEGVEGMIHVGDISAEKRINHPQDVLKVGQVVKAQVLELDIEKRRLRLGMKQLMPTSLDEYIAEHKEGDVVTGRMVEVSGEPRPRGTGRRRAGGLPGRRRGSRPQGREGRGSQDRPLFPQLDAGGQMEGRPGGRRKPARVPPLRPDPQFPHRQARPRFEEDRSRAGITGPALAASTLAYGACPIFRPRPARSPAGASKAAPESLRRRHGCPSRKPECRRSERSGRCCLRICRN